MGWTARSRLQSPTQLHAAWRPRRSVLYRSASQLPAIPAVTWQRKPNPSPGNVPPCHAPRAPPDPTTLQTTRPALPSPPPSPPGPLHRVPHQRGGPLRQLPPRARPRDHLPGARRPPRAHGQPPVPRLPGAAKLRLAAGQAHRVGRGPQPGGAAGGREGKRWWGPTGARWRGRQVARVLGRCRWAVRRVVPRCAWYSGWLACAVARWPHPLRSPLLAAPLPKARPTLLPFRSPQALNRMSRALDELVITGVPTTAPFHKLIMGHEAFRRGEVGAWGCVLGGCCAQKAKPFVPSSS